MKPGLVSPVFFCLLSVSLYENPLTILVSISETAISDLFRKSNIFIKSSMILGTFKFNPVFKLSYETIMLFDCSWAFSPTFCHCHLECRNCVNIGYS